MKKKSPIAILCFAMALSLAGCSSGDNKEYAIENDYVQVAKYKGIEVESEKAEVTDEEIEEQIQTDLTSLATTEEIKDRAARKGDMVNIDFAGYQDDEPVENSDGDDYDLQLGSGGFVPGFEDELVGLKTGEEKEFDITFPDDYVGSKELQGQEVTFKVKVNAVKEVTLPELTDETVHRLNNGYKTVKDYKTGITERLQEREEEEIESNIKSNVWNKIIDASNVKNVPDDRADEMKETLDSLYHKIAEANKMEFEDFIEQKMLASAEEYEEIIEKSAKQAVGQELIMEAIAEKEDLTISDEEYEEKVNNYAMNMGFNDKEELEEYYSKDYVMNLILTEKVRTFCADEAKITVSDASAAAKEEEEDSSN